MKRLTVIVHKNPLNQSICCNRKAIHQAGTLHSQIKLKWCLNVTPCFVCGRDFAQQSSSRSNTSPGMWPLPHSFIHFISFHFIHNFPKWNIFTGFYLRIPKRTDILNEWDTSGTAHYNWVRIFREFPYFINTDRAFECWLEYLDLRGMK